MMKDFIEYIAKHLVDNPEAVKVAEVEGEKTTVYELRVGDGCSIRETWEARCPGDFGINQYTFQENGDGWG